jgi:hypothetical protein
MAFETTNRVGQDISSFLEENPTLEINPDDLTNLVYNLEIVIIIFLDIFREA